MSYHSTATSDEPDADRVESVLDTLVDDRIALLNQRVAMLERNATENERLVSELLAQATADFEERTWMRRLFDDLQNFDARTALSTIKINLLAPLRHLLSARCVRLIPVNTGTPVELPHVVVGECPMGVEGCSRFARDVYDLTASHRFLFNRGELAHDDHIVPREVDGVIAMGVTTGDELRGWLLVFDKLANLAEPGVFPVGTSETEFGTVEFSLAECAAYSLAARLRLLDADPA